MGVTSPVFAFPPVGGCTSVPHSTAYPRRADGLSTGFTSHQPGERSWETGDILPKNAALKPPPPGGLPHRPLSRPSPNAGLSREDCR